MDEENDVQRGSLTNSRSHNLNSGPPNSRSFLHLCSLTKAMIIDLFHNIPEKVLRLEKSINPGIWVQDSNHSCAIYGLYGIGNVT